MSATLASRWSTRLERHPYLWLSLVCALLYLPGIARLPVVDRDEARYLQATRQMLESGDLISIRFQDTARNKKPVGIHWLQALAVGTLSDARSNAAWPYRIPSVLGAWASVLLTFRFARGRLGGRLALLAAVALASSIALASQALQARPDAALLATVIVAQAALGRVYLGWRAGSREPVDWRTVVAFWACLGAGFLLKGPVGLGVTGLTALALALTHRSGRWLLELRPLAGALIFSAVVLPWSLAVSLGTEGEFFREAASRDWLAKLSSAQEGHGAPPGYYALTALLAFWPASLLLAPALAAAWRERTDPVVAFCLAWALPTWLLLELVPTKLPHYTLPLFPALALLVARLASGASAPPLRPAFAWTYRGLWLLATGMLALVLALLPVSLGMSASPVALGLAGVVLTASVVLVSLDYRRRPAAVLGAGLVAALALVPALSALCLPALTPAWLSQSVAEAVQAARRYPGETVAVSGIAEPSLVFLLGTRTRLTDPEGAVQHMVTGPGHLAVVSEGDRPAFEQALGARRRSAQLQASVRGLNYSKGRWTTLHVYRLAR